MLERAIVAHGAPTLAGLKLGSLFNVALAELDVYKRQLPRGRELKYVSDRHVK